MSKQKIIIIDTEARNAIKDGVKQLAKIVAVTLGPKGRNVIIEKDYGIPISTKDGVTVAREINLKDPFENIGAQMVKEASSKTASAAGDGTTTATVLAAAIYEEGLKYIAAGVNPIELKRGIDKAVDIIVDNLSKMSIDITSSDEIKQVASISANNDIEIGKLIAAAMDKVGKDGVITIEDSKNYETSLEVVEGIQFNRGLLSPYFVTDTTTMQATLENPYILICDKKISNLKDVLPLLEAVANKNESLLIICDDVVDEALAGMIVNKSRGLLKVCPVKAPDFGEKRTQVMEDIAIITGGTYLAETKGYKLEKIASELFSGNKLGKARLVTVTKDKVTIVDGAGTEESIQKRLEEIKTQIENSDSDYEIEKLQSRLAKLAGGVAILHVGAHTETELKEKKDRLDDALHATKAAVQEGIVPGGGIALLNAIQSLQVECENEDQKLGVDIVIKACKYPFNYIITNAGKNPDIIYYEIFNSKNEISNVGYDARNSKVVDMIKEGIIDPTKVTRTALQNAASIAGVLLTTEAIVAKDPEQESKSAANLDMYN